MSDERPPLGLASNKELILGYKIGYQTAKQAGKNDVDSEDIGQETMIKIWEKFEPVQDGNNTKLIESFAKRVATNKGIDFHRKSHSSLWKPFPEEVEDERGDMLDTGEKLELLKTILSRLSPPEENLITKYWLKEVPIKQIAEDLGCSEGKIYRDIRIILQKMKRISHCQE